MRSYIAIAALAAFAKAQDITSSDDSSATTATSSSTYSFDTSIPTDPADALDIAGIEAIPEPTYTEVLGLASQVVSYAAATAISSAAADISTDPLTVYPAATDVALNADGEDESDESSATSTAAVEKRGLARRTACAPAATITNTYGVDVSSYTAFKADKIIESVANAAATPAGYYQNFKNAKGANSAYAYLGYNQLKTGYDVAACAAACTKKTGCLAFNIYFERDPVVEPSTSSAAACYNPDAFANIKCSFWGSVLDLSTATNKGQWQGGFQVGISGSNAYSLSSTGEPIDGTTYVSLGNSIMNAPLRDCAGTWTYMGYKLYTSGPYEPRLCKAACDAQTAYDIANPPDTGSPATCSGFGSYVLTKYNSSGAFVQGQMCTLYTAGWGKQYAVNTVSYDDSVGAKWNYTLSYFYNITAAQPSCPITKRDLIPSRLFRF